MKLKTSFFDLTLFKKDITRYAPVWGLYTIGMVLVMFEIFYYRDYDRAAYSLNSVIMSYGVVNLIYAGICAVMLYGDLFNTRMCYSLHALPQQRQTRLGSHFAAAMLFSFVPTLVCVLLMMPAMSGYWYLLFYWLLANQLQFVFFFGLATVSAMLTGNRFAMLVVYTLVNFISMIGLWALEVVFMPNLIGVVVDRSIFDFICPVVNLFRFDFMLVFKMEKIPTADPDYSQTFYRYVGLGDGWGYYIGIAAVGLLLMAAAVWLYRKRHLESAGDFVAFPKLKWVACVIFTVCGSCVGAMIGEAFAGGMIIWMGVALAVCFFGSLMLLERRVKVFKGKRFLALIALAAVLVCCYLASVFDVFGIRNWLPDVNKVESVTVGNFMVSSSNLDRLNVIQDSDIVVTLTDPEQIADIVRAHKEILKDRQATGSKTYRVTLRYKMKNGREVIRTYRVSTEQEHYHIIRKYWYTTDQIMGYTDWESYVESVDHIAINGVPVSVSEKRTILEALRSDCDDGNLVPNLEDKYAHYVEIIGENEDGGHFSRVLYLSQDAKNMEKILRSPQIMLGYTDMDSFVERISYIYIDGQPISEEVVSKVADMIIREFEKGTVVLGYAEGPIYMEVQLHAGGNGSMNWYTLTVMQNSEELLPWIREGEYAR